MTMHKDDLRAFFRNRPDVVLVEVTNVKGSTPRNEGAWMLVAPDGIYRTIGGGQLEFMAIERARETFNAVMRGASACKSEASDLTQMDIPLGPEIGQCCGGRVHLNLKLVNPALRASLIARYDIELSTRPNVYIFGAGHIGEELALILSRAPVQVVLVDSRENELANICASGIETCLTPLPEEVVRSAPAGSAFVILTHTHALDFLIAKEALMRDDFSYVGMIGSKTKLATFKSWLAQETGKKDMCEKLVCPIGGTMVKDKRPAVIATLVAAEILTAVLNYKPSPSSLPLT